jgi:hypothetical protein
MKGFFEGWDQDIVAGRNEAPKEKHCHQWYKLSPLCFCICRMHSDINSLGLTAHTAPGSYSLTLI